MCVTEERIFSSFVYLFIHSTDISFPSLSQTRPLPCRRLSLMKKTDKDRVVSRLRRNLVGSVRKERDEGL